MSLLGGTVLAALFLIELTALGGRAKLEGLRVRSRELHEPWIPWIEAREPVHEHPVEPRREPGRFLHSIGKLERRHGLSR